LSVQPDTAPPATTNDVTIVAQDTQRAHQRCVESTAIIASAIVRLTI